MVAEFKHSLLGYVGQILGWGVGLALLGLLIVPMYDSFAAEQETFQQLLDLFPPEVMVFFGDLSGMTSPEGWLSLEFFSYMPLILGIFAIQAGTGMLAKAEEEGILDLVIAHPVSRLGLFVGRFLAFLVALTAVLLIGWLGIILPMSWSAMDLSSITVARPFLILAVELVLFGSLGLIFSQLLPSRRWASMVSGLILVASFFISGLAQLNQDLEKFAWLSPLEYYQPREAFSGLNGEWLLGLAAAALVFILLAGWRFLRRDLRIAGEGGWGGWNFLPGKK